MKKKAQLARPSNLPGKMNVRQIEIAVANHFNYRMNIIVPNISWGLFDFGRMEADLIILRPSGWATEIEIKTNAADISRDQKKRRHLFGPSELIYRKFFAVPEELAFHPSIPIEIGVLAVNENGMVRTIRTGFLNKKARKFDEEETRKLLRLGCMRIWSLKEKLSRLTFQQNVK